MSSLIFYLSINGLFSNDNILFSFILFVIGLLLFIYSLIYIIKNKSINYFLLIPFLFFISGIAGTYYYKIDHIKMQNVAIYILANYKMNGNNISLDELINDDKIPKNMEIIEGDNEIIIVYKDLVYFVYNDRFLDKDHFLRDSEELNLNIIQKIDLFDSIFKLSF
jgi:hypothetical protein